MTYSKALNDFVKSYTPTAIELDYQIIVDRLVSAGGTFYLAGSQLPKWFVDQRNCKIYRKDAILFGNAEDGYEFKELEKFWIEYNDSFINKTLVFTPKIQATWAGGSSWIIHCAFEDSLASLTDLLPPIQEIEMPDKVVTFQVPPWLEIQGEDPYSSIAAITMFKKEAECALFEYMQSAQKILAE
jgi:hypothetical protein